MSWCGGADVPAQPPGGRGARHVFCMTLDLSVALQFADGDFSARVYLVGSIFECRFNPHRVDL